MLVLSTLRRYFDMTKKMTRFKELWRQFLEHKPTRKDFLTVILLAPLFRQESAEELLKNYSSPEVVQFILDWLTPFRENLAQRFLADQLKREDFLAATNFSVPQETLLQKTTQQPIKLSKEEIIREIIKFS